MEDRSIVPDEMLVEQIKNSVNNQQIVETRLKTDERVIARVTDGIYRQPGSALRELITNAYDADATRVVVKTDAPRFSRISVEDNGHGMTPEVLGHMLLHIGGSAKRNSKGQDLGISSDTNPSLSPNGRFLIGKIGIGVFSVAQLTYHFQIITKVKGDTFRTIASVALKQYTDDSESIEENQVYESGKVAIWREKATDIEVHGTTIVLTNIRPQARETLQSSEIWSSVVSSEENSSEEVPLLEPPKYNIGMVDKSGVSLRSGPDGKTDSLPWNKDDTPLDAFSKLVQSVWAEIETSNPNPKLEKLFDYYLQMVWNLSLSIPLPYIDVHLFDMPLDATSYNYSISNEPKGNATRIADNPTQTFRSTLNLKEGLESYNFEVYFDDLKLSRPIKFRNLPMSAHALKMPLILVGKCEETFSKYPPELSGGILSFEAYLFWTPKVAPSEHRGSLIRVHGASGTLFDQSFLRYQVAELTRLRQITCEIFIHRGFDSALNIDRESFNQAHPHTVFITRWLHSALRQLATTQKRLASEVRSAIRSEISSQFSDELSKIASDVWRRESRDEFSPPPSVSLNQESDLIDSVSTPDIIIDLPSIQRKLTNYSKLTPNRNHIISEKLKAITQVLASFDLLEKLSSSEQERLFSAIYEILEIAE